MKNALLITLHTDVYTTKTPLICQNLLWQCMMLTFLVAFVAIHSAIVHNIHREYPIPAKKSVLLEILGIICGRRWRSDRFTFHSQYCTTTMKRVVHLCHVALSSHEEWYGNSLTFRAMLSLSYGQQATGYFGWLMSQGKHAMISRSLEPEMDITCLASGQE